VQRPDRDLARLGRRHRALGLVVRQHECLARRERELDAEHAQTAFARDAGPQRDLLPAHAAER
jgi:hypothetical protein